MRTKKSKEALLREQKEIDDLPIKEKVKVYAAALSGLKAANALFDLVVESNRATENYNSLLVEKRNRLIRENIEEMQHSTEYIAEILEQRKNGLDFDTGD